MQSSKTKKYIEPMYVNGMSGRLLRLPMPKRKNKNILLLYGQHASVERMFGIAEVFHKYGAVTVPDLPGFGGMDSFYKVGRKPTLDNYADYLAAFITLHYKRKKFVIVGTSFSFLIVTRTLQKYPEIAKQVELLVSLVGFLHRDDFHVNKFYYWSWRALAVTFSSRLASTFFRYTALQPWIIRLSYTFVASRHPKLKGTAKAKQKKQIEAEIKLWHMNDVRTRMKTLSIMLKVDLCDKRVDLPVYHVSVANDFYFNNDVVAQHMRVVYRNFEATLIDMPAHMPTVIADAQEADPFVPQRIRELLGG